MRIQLMITLVCLVFLGFNVQAGTKKSSKKKSIKYETIGGKKYQVEEAKVVKAGPLNQPESAKLRKEREQMEMATEEEFIQKLEQARIDDERARRQELFEKQLRTTVSEDADPFIDPESNEDLDDMESQMDPEPISMAPPMRTTAPLRIDEPSKNKYYISLNAGGLNHQANNVPNMNGSGGVSAGIGVGSDFWLEGSFIYSFLETERATLPNEDIDMFGFTFGPKYTFGFSNHWVTPVIGVLAGFTRRQYDAGENNSNALDAGISAGVELALNNSVKIGLEGRYMTNLDYEKDNPIDATDKAIEEFETGRAVQPLEDFDYSLIMANMKMVF